MSRRRSANAKEIAAVQKWEQESLSDFLFQMGSIGNNEELKSLYQAVQALVFAQNPRQVMDVINANPSLLTDKADAVLHITELFVAHVPMTFAPTILEDRRECLARMREVAGGPRGSTLPDA